jgi:hypothetical protein
MPPTKQEASAIERFALNVTIPIIIEMGNEAKLHATGTLFEIAERHFIITARHIFDDLKDLTRLAFPENPTRGGLHTFGSFELSKPKEDSPDVAIMEIKCNETISRLKHGWQFLSLANVALPSVISSDGSFFLSGYPSGLTRNNVDGWLQGKFATAYTQRISDTPVEARFSNVTKLDLFFDYGSEATSITGGIIQTPELPGTSGASVWERKVIEPLSVWTPEASVRVVGVQSSYIHKKYFRATDWRAVANVIAMIDTRISEDIRLWLSRKN